MFITVNNTALQCMPPNMHQTNAVKRAVKTWKCHFKEGLTSLPKQFPITHWCQLMTQCDIIFNMQQPCWQTLNSLPKKPSMGLFTSMQPNGYTGNKMLCPHQTTVLSILGPQCYQCALCQSSIAPLLMLPHHNSRCWCRTHF